MTWHSLKLEDIFERLGAGSSGLSSDEAAERTKKYGLNELQFRKKTSSLMLFINQFKNFLIYILIVATFISFLIGEVVDAGIIAAIVVLNAVLGFIQEYKAELSIESLKSLIVQEAFVIRDGHLLKVPASTLVPGDVIVLEAGENVPADSRIIEAVSLKVDESALTGESEPSSKWPAMLPGDTLLGDMKNMLFMGTSIMDGRAKAMVVETGMSTEIGRIANLVEAGTKRETPMQVSIDRLGKFFGILALATCAIIFVVGLIGGQSLFEMFMVSVSLAVAAIPEGLPATITIVLALGVQRMARRKAVVRKLPAVETLGSTSVICSDKTGTLTQNIIVLKRIVTADREYSVTGEGYSSEGAFISDGDTVAIDPGVSMLLKAGTLCNNATYERLGNKWNIIGDSTEVAILAAASKAGFNKVLLEDECPRLLEVPFRAGEKRMATVNACGDKKYVFVKGAPEIVLDLSVAVFKGGDVVPLDERYRQHFLKYNEAMASKGMRVLGFAYKEVDGDPRSISEREIESRLIYLGLAGMIDPPRPEAKDSIRRCKEAGIDVVMITGDHKLTALAIASELGIYREGDGAVTGVELNDMSEEALDQNVERIKVYARTSPEQKLRIVEALKRRDMVVAMTGDGVNDAPSLKRADIGVAMGITGTDVSRQAADLVLMDDNFATIVAAIEEGRRIYDNVKKVVKFLFSSNMGEVLTVFLGIIMGLPLPLLAIQILWVNLITDSFPALALSMDPAGGGIMKRPPRPRSEGILTRLTLFDMALVGITIAIGTLGIFYFYLPHGIEAARTVSFTVLVVFQLWNSLNCRSETRSLFSIGVLANRYLVLAIAVSLLLQGIILYIPFFEGMFRLTALSAYDWLAVLAVTSSVLIVIEIRKLASGLLKIKT